jgi:hypothetical protein
MFSFFKEGIEDTYPKEIIHLQTLVELTKNNPQKDLIQSIRGLRECDDDTFKEKKKLLSNITPACIVKYRSLKDNHFHSNFLASSGYVYIDFDFKDGAENVIERKKLFLEKYEDKVAYCALSSSLGGFSVLVRVNIPIKTKEEYLSVWDYLTANVFTLFSPDIKARDLGRAMFLSQDEDVYVNYNSILDLKSVQDSIYGMLCIRIPDLNKYKSKGNKLPINKSYTNNDEDNNFSISGFTSDLRYVSKIIVNNPIVDIEEKEYNKVFFDRNIPDGKKHEVYTSIINKLRYINPNCTIDDIIHYMLHLNSCQTNKMTNKRLMELIQFQWKETEKPDYIFLSGVKMIHFNPSCGLTSHQRTCISNEINAQLKRNETIRRIKNAKAIILANGGKITKTNVAEISGVSRTSVYSYFDADEVDIKQLELRINNYPITYPPHPDPDKPKRRRSKRKAS